MRLEDLVTMYLGDLTLWDRDKQLAVPMQCDSVNSSWAGVLPAPRILYMSCNFSDLLSVVLDCNETELRRFWDMVRDFHFRRRMDFFESQERKTPEKRVREIIEKEMV